MAICLLVNEDLQKTFSRIDSLKNNQKPAKYIPGESQQDVHYLVPTHIYGQDLQLERDDSDSPNKSNDVPDLLNMGGPSEPPKAQ